MLIWWVTESISISVTALLPLVVFPIFDVMDMNSVGANYGSSIVFLFFGGFVLALGLEKVNLHKRIALYIISKVGGTPNRIIMGFMISTAFLSMWITNTASTVVMLPIAISVIKLLIDKNEFNRYDNNSELFLLNSLDPGIKMKISENLFFLIKQSIYFHEISNGYFDITTASLMPDADKGNRKCNIYVCFYLRTRFDKKHHTQKKRKLR